MMEDDSFEAVVVDMINQLEGQGVDFKEEVGFIEMWVEERPDVLIRMTFVDKDTEISFQQTEALMERLQ